MIDDLNDLWKHLRAYHRRVYFIVGVAVAATAVELAIEIMIRPLVDHGILGGDPKAFASIVAAQLACYLAAMGLNVVHVRGYVGLSADVSQFLRDELFEKSQRLPLSYYYAENSASLPIRITNEVGSVAGVIGQTLGSLGVSALQAVAASALLFWIEWRLALVVMVMLPANVWLARRVGTTNERLEKEYYSLYEQVTRFLQERLSFSARLAFSDPAARAGALARFSRYAVEMRRTGYDLAILTHNVSLALYAVTTLGVLGVYALGGYLIINGALTLGGLLMFIAVKAYLERPLTALATGHIALKDALVHWRRIREILIRDEEPATGGSELPAGDIVFEAVSFRHGPTTVLDGLTARFPRGALITLVGETGAGKTTLTLLLLKHLRPSSGRIRIGDVDLTSVSSDSLREGVAYLGQDPLLLSGTVRENITLFRPGATDEEVRGACRAAALEGLLERLPKGLETPVADGGASLSGGERQRICLARALLKKPKLLILDEPTAALDEATESDICRVLRALVDEGGLSVIAVTHRRALADASDLVVRIRGGRAEAVGQ